MSELRIDAFTGIPVVIAPGRRGIGATRPAGLPDVARERCPFCPGHEAETEATVLALGAPWQVRVVANKYPLLREAPDAPSHSDARGAWGAHEVVIESRDHAGDLATYGAAQATLVLTAIRARMRVLEARAGVATISVFRNRGRRAGSSQPHPHSQIVALPYVPPATALRAARGPDVLARALERERADGARIVLDEEDVVTFCPFASHRAWEARLALAGPCARLSAIDDARLEVLARRLVDVVQRLSAALGALDYNVLVRDPPIGVDSFFTIDVLPRTGGDAGFELQTGTPICVVAPEEAALALRGAEPGIDR